MCILIACLVASCGVDAGPEPVSGALRFSELDAGYYHTCGLATSGRVYCWGNNGFGTLGDGTRTGRAAPAEVADGLTNSALDAGAGHNCALARNGVAECWGQNDEGQVGDGSFTARAEPVPVTGGRVFTQVSAGHAHSCGLTSGGVAFCWGDDSRGQLGAGAESPGKSAIPLRVQGDQPFARISAGYYQTCALTVAGEAWCWGLNSSGQNGDGTSLDRNVPVRARSDRLFTALSPGDRFVCGSSDGAGICWGGAIRGWPASGATRALSTELRLERIAAGAQHVCAISRAGYAYCIGANYDGQLGDGTHSDRAALMPVIAPGNAVP
ncbi:MAG: RCC1 domain-containing protein [Gemmatimonadota bacterium]